MSCLSEITADTGKRKRPEEKDKSTNKRAKTEDNQISELQLPN